MISVEHAIPRHDVLLGIVRTEGIEASRYPDGFDRRLDECLARRKEGLSEAEEARRAAARDILRNGRYKPTGRGKPANEYLLRAVTMPDYEFPRINGPVDICNYLSLLYVVPISLWDLDRADASRFTFRLGLQGESYVFNTADQEIDLEDLLVGCRVQARPDHTELPIVNPVKDSLQTKTTPETDRVAAAIYAPTNAFSAPDLELICREFLELLAGCGDRVDGGYAVVSHGSTLEA